MVSNEVIPFSARPGQRSLILATFPFLQTAGSRKSLVRAVPLALSALAYLEGFRSHPLLAVKNQGLRSEVDGWTLLGGSGGSSRGCRAHGVNIGIEVDIASERIGVRRVG